MSGIRMEVSVDDGGLGRALQRAIDLGDDLKPGLEASAILIEGSIAERFETERGPGGIAWIPSKAALGLAPRASSGKVQPGKTLTDRGALRGSISHEARDTEVEIGTGANSQGDVQQKAAALQWGVAGINLPARPFIGFDDQDLADLEDLWTDVVKEPFGGN
ncbi:MAG TPA: phage virion morphogenesis protein [Allosphingosinicella sp.]|nr:phage virion morphogenesis protein [Allosphingosinicella sp.]